MRRDYRISDVRDYINWTYFFHAWSVPAASDEGMRLFDEAQRLLNRLQPYVTVKAVVEVLPAYSEGDDIVVQRMLPCECGQSHPYGEPVRLPMLRQQHPGKDGLCLCMSDFIRPQSMFRGDKMGVFATSVCTDGEKCCATDDYGKMLMQTLSDRLAEAGAERLHEEVRKSIWGYAPHEELTVEEMHQEKFQGIRPAVGYPCLPDISINFIIDKIINFQSIGVTLTEHAMMRPHASVSGLMISLLEARYFAVGTVDETQVRDYARRRNMTFEEIKTYVPCY